MRARAAAALMLAAMLVACAQLPAQMPAGIVADDAPEITERPAPYDLSDVSGTGGGLPRIWTYEKNGHTVAVFGTMHAVPAGFKWLSADVKRAFASADLVFTEVGTTDVAQYNPRVGDLDDLAGLLNRHDGQNTLDLAALPGTLERAELDAAIEMTGIKTASTQSLQPWALCLDLQRGETEQSLSRLSTEARDMRVAAARSVGEIETGQASPDARIERFRLSQNLAHRQLETFATRARVYAALSDAEAIICIRNRAHAIVSGADWTDYPRRFRAAFAHWTSGDIDGARRSEMAETMKISAGFAAQLFQGREAQWLAVIAARCDAAGINCALAVGLAHLGGTDGLLKGLERMGYRRVQAGS